MSVWRSFMHGGAFFARRTRFDGHTLCADSLFNSSSRVAACDFRTQFRQIAADVSTTWRSNIARRRHRSMLNINVICYFACPQQTQENILWSKSWTKNQFLRYCFLLKHLANNVISFSVIVSYSRKKIILKKLFFKEFSECSSQKAVYYESSGSYLPVYVYAKKLHFISKSNMVR
jgi:hypothetical protein